ncbi:MAG TPA: terminase [Patescibacteria group bacterium]|nr:terminase [Patescibacteria group bacterium]
MIPLTSPPSAPVSAEVLPGYRVEAESGAWLTLPHGPPDGPTLGWGVIAWVEARVRSHLTGEPWRYTPGQMRLLLWWYALADDATPDRPRWLFRSGVKRGVKGSGKDPILATLALAEACGPTYPVWDGRRWVGRAHNLPLVQIGANNESQGREPLAVANGMIDGAMKVEYGIDRGILRTQLANGGRIEVLTSVEAANEGDPATAIFLNESQHMREASNGQRLAAVVRRNVGKSPGGLARILEFTNTHMPGEGSVAEASWEAWQAQVAGRTRRRDILYDSREAPPHLSIHDEDQLMAGLRAAYADSPWVDLERIRDEAQDPRVPIADTVRYYLGGLPEAAAAWVDPRRFDAGAHPDRVLAEHEPIALFLDCSKSGDATTLAGACMSDGHVLALGVWQRPHGDRGRGWLAPRHEVDARVREVFKRCDVWWFGVDPSPAADDETEASYWGEVIDLWHRDFRDERRDGVLLWATPGERTGSAVRFDLRQSEPGARERLREFTAAAEATALEIEEGTLTWDGDPILRSHVHNARRRPNQFGISLGKRSRDSSQLVDYAVSMVGARLGRRRLLNAGLSRARRRTREATF